MQQPLVGLVTATMRDFAAATPRRRAVPASMHLGHPQGERIDVLEQSWYDAGIRADLLTRAVDGLEDQPTLAWLTRCGDLGPTGADHAWCAATLTAFARHGLALPGFYVITRRGWCEPLAGIQQLWTRVRSSTEW